MLFYLCADPDPLGKMDALMLSDQQRMEMFFPNFRRKTARVALRGDADHACSWTGVECTEEDAVHAIRWNSDTIKLHGTLHFEALPPHTGTIDITWQGKLKGTIETALLPAQLQFFSVAHCGFSGTLDLAHLPRHLVTFQSKNNRITGICDLKDLPESLEVCHINESWNKASELSVGKLPERKVDIRLYGSSIKTVLLEDENDAPRVRF